VRSVTRTREKDKEMPTWAAEQMSNLVVDMARMVWVPEDQGREFAEKCRKLTRELGRIRRGLIAQQARAIPTQEVK